MSSPRIPIVPALIPKSADDVIAFVSKLSFVHEVHIDVVDGEFVPSVSWPIAPSGLPMMVKTHTDTYTLEVDLMMKNPFPAAREWEQAGADMIIFHVETIDEASFVDFCKHSAVSVGIAFHGGTSLEALKPFVSYTDYIQVMGIEEIGAQGQPFSNKTLEKVEILKVQYPSIPVSVDGSVNKETIKQIIKAGADRVIVGSAISRAPDMESAYRELVEIVNG